VEGEHERGERERRIVCISKNKISARMCTCVEYVHVPRVYVTGACVREAICLSGRQTEKVESQHVFTYHVGKAEELSCERRKWR
jgi:hypothetical protein